MMSEGLAEPVKGFNSGKSPGSNTSIIILETSASDHGSSGQGDKGSGGDENRSPDDQDSTTVLARSASTGDSVHSASDGKSLTGSGGKITPQNNGEMATEDGELVASLTSSPRTETNTKCVEETYTATVSWTALPCEYEFRIPTQVFDADFPSWSETREFTEAGFSMKTTLSLLTNISKRNGERETSVIVLIAVLNAESDCRYRAFTKVTLYDPSAGRQLSEKEEERGFTGKCGHVKFTVSLGSLKDIECCRSRILKLQVKVKVHQERTVSYQNLELVY